MSWLSNIFGLNKKSNFGAELQKLSSLSETEIQECLNKEREVLAKQYKPVVCKTKFRNAIVGLENPSYFCYMNSVLQCLAHSDSLRDYFLRSEWWKELNPLSSPSKGQLACEFWQFLERYWTANKDEMSATGIRSVVKKVKGDFSSWEQHDAQELLCYFLDWLHEDLNKVVVKPYQLIEDFKEENDVKEFLSNVFKVHQNRNKSFIVDTFHGQFYTRIMCPEIGCGYRSIVGDPFENLSLPVPDSSKANIEVYYLPSSYETPIEKYELKCHGNHTIDDIMSHFSQTTKEHKNQRFRIFLFEKLRIVSSELERHIKTVSALDASPYMPIISETFNAEISSLVFGSRKEEVVTKSWTDAHKLRVQVFVNKSFDGVERMIEVPKSVNLSEIELLLFLVHRKVLVDGKLFVLEEPKSYPKTNEEAVAELQSFKNQMAKRGKGEKLEVKIVDFSDKTDLFFEDTKNMALRVNWELTLARNTDSLKMRMMSRMTIPALPQKIDALIRLEDCFKIFVDQEELDRDNTWYCPKCKQHRNAIKESLVNKLPTVLVVHLRRFKKIRSRDGFVVEKNESEVQIPMRIDMKPFAFEPTDDCLYDLYGIVNHYGTLSKGHYTATVKSEDGTWIAYDDEKPLKVKEKDVSTRSAYLAFFKRSN